MNAFVILALASLPQNQAADIVETYVAKHVSAARLIKSLTEVFGLDDPATQSVKMNLKATYDPATNRVILSGAKDDVTQALSLLEIFDVRPAKLNITCQWFNSRGEAEGTFQIIVKNNHEVSIDGLEEGLEISVKPRLNGDGTVTLALKFGGEALPSSKGAAVVVRVKQGEEIVLASPLTGNVEELVIQEKRETYDSTFRFKVTEKA